MKKSLIILSLLLALLMVSCKCKHKWGNWQVESEKTCTTDHVEKRICEKCDEVETRIVEKKGHNLDNNYIITTEGHYAKCLDCNEFSNIEAHIEGEPSVNGTILCSKCSYLMDVGGRGFYKNLVSSFENNYMLKIDNLVIKVVPEFGSSTEINLSNIKCQFEMIDGKNVGYLIGEICIKIIENDLAVKTLNLNGRVICIDDMFYLIGDIDSPNIQASNSTGDYYLTGQIDELIFSDIINYPLSLDEFYQLLLDGKQVVDFFTEESVKEFIEIFFITSKKEDKYELEFTVQHIKEFFDNASEKTIKELINHYFGKYAFGDLLIDVEFLLDLKIDLVISELEKKLGVTIPELFSELDELARNMTGQENITFEQFIGFSIDLEELLTSEEFKSKTILQILSEEVDVTEKELLDKIISKIEEIGDSYVFDFFIQGDMKKEEIEKIINEIFEKLENSFSLKIITNENGISEKINIKLNFDTLVNGEIIFDSNLEKFNYDEIFTEVNEFFKEINFESFYTNNENQQILVEKDKKGNVTNITIKNIEHNYIYTVYEEKRVIFEDEIVESTYYFDIDSFKTEKMALLYCDDWCKFNLLGDFKVEEVNYIINYYYDTNYDNLLYTTESEHLFNDIQLTSFDFLLNLKTNEFVFEENDEETMHDLELIEVIEPTTDKCSDYYTYVYECKNCQKQFKEYEFIGHSEVFRYENEFLEENYCSKGVLVKAFCRKCDQLISKELIYNHQKYLTEYIIYSDEKCTLENNIHGIEVSECPCKTYVSYKIINLNNETYDIVDNQMVKMYYCNYCPYRIKKYETSISSDCSIVNHITLELYKGSTLINKVEITDIDYHHSFETKYRYVEESNMNEVEKYQECSRCGFEE